MARVIDVSIQLHPDVLRTTSQRKILDYLTRQKIIFKKHTLRQKFQLTTSKLTAADIKRNLLRALQRDFAIFYARGQQWRARLEKNPSNQAKAQKELQETWQDCLDAAQNQLKTWAQEFASDDDTQEIELKNPKQVAKTLVILCELEKKLVFLKNIDKLQRDVLARVQAQRRKPEDTAAQIDQITSRAAAAMESLFAKHGKIIGELKIAQTLFAKPIEVPARRTGDKQISQLEKILARGTRELFEDVSEAQEGLDELIAQIGAPSTTSLAAVYPDPRTITAVMKAAKTLQGHLGLKS
ncbi:MAG: hypothetical protein AAF442_02290 [Pseudomonadota bacterium]